MEATQPLLDEIKLKHLKSFDSTHNSKLGILFANRESFLFELLTVAEIIEIISLSHFTLKALIMSKWKLCINIQMQFPEWALSAHRCRNCICYLRNSISRSPM